jgi:hypothetical protein
LRGDDDVIVQNAGGVIAWLKRLCTRALYSAAIQTLQEEPTGFILTKGSTVTVAATPQGTPLKAAYCYYIPPKFVDEKPPVVSDEQFRNYFAAPDKDNMTGFLPITAFDADVTIPESGFCRLHIQATTTAVSTADIRRNGQTIDRKAFPITGINYFASEFVVSQGDIITVLWTNATFMTNNTFIYRPKFESVMAANSSYPFAETDSAGYYNIYVSPGGNNTNDGRTAATPLLTIEQAFTNASKVAFTAKGGIRISLAAGEYTLTPNYVVPNFDNRVTVGGPGATPSDVVVNVSGSTCGWYFNRASVTLSSFTVRGTLDGATVGAGLVNFFSNVVDVTNMRFVGTSKANRYAGMCFISGISRLSSNSFIDLPVAIESYGAYVGSVWPASSSGNDLFYSACGGIIDSPPITPTSYTKYKEETNGGRVIGHNIQLPANTDLNTLVTQGVYNNISATAIDNGPAGLATSQNTLVEVQQLQDGSQGVNQHLKQFPVNSSNTNLSEWVRNGFNNAGTVTWGSWKRFATDTDIEPLMNGKIRRVYATSSSKVWIRILSLTTPTAGGEQYEYAINFIGGNANASLSQRAIGQLYFGVRNDGSSISVFTRLTHNGPTTATSIQFGHSPVPSPGGIIDLYFTTTGYPELRYTNFGKNLITPDGIISSPITTQPSGYVAIAPTALATS